MKKEGLSKTEVVFSIQETSHLLSGFRCVAKRLVSSLDLDLLLKHLQLTPSPLQPTQQNQTRTSALPRQRFDTKPSKFLAASAS